MLFLVRNIPNRKLHESYNQINYQLLTDYKKDPINHFIDSLKYSGGEPFVLLEDDLVLCNDFEKEVCAVIEKYNDDIINFFSDAGIYIKVGYRQSIRWNQCTYYPKGVGLKLAEKMEQYPQDFDKSHGVYSILETRAVKELNLKVLDYRPCLVQHLDMDTSLFNKTTHSRRSPFFIDYLNNLNVTYDRLTDKEYYALIKLMKEHFKELEKWYYE